ALCVLRHLGIGHFDIKPSNVLIADDGRAVLSDFSMARAVPVAGYDEWHRTSFLGTFPYMSPEMVAGD
ncbi:kinase-like domain-containing protein, partial [Epithele typhae]|uniref:kinase-like domain-containing protein n=1 Tax=Epithele typhae TaxID=378194 RepID=UPI0020082407